MERLSCVYGPDIRYSPECWVCAARGMQAATAASASTAWVSDVILDLLRTTGSDRPASLIQGMPPRAKTFHPNMARTLRDRQDDWTILCCMWIARVVKQ